MLRIKDSLAPLVLGAAMLASLLTSGCAARATYYDSYRTDYHPWGDQDIRAYRVWLAERHYGYRDFNRLSPADQRAYWRWRHDYPNRY